MNKHHGPTESNPEELPEELLQIAQFYADQPVPQPTLEETDLLIERLLCMQASTAQTYLSWHVSRIQILRVACWQIMLLGPWFWVLGVLLLIAGFVLAPSILGVESAVNLLITLLPFTAILSVVHAVRALSLHVHEVEASCPTNVIETTAALALAIVCFDVLLGVIATVAVALVHWAPFSVLLLTWLGPLLLLVGISLPVALRWGTLPALLIGGAPWLLLIMVAYTSQYPTLGHISLVGHDTTRLALSGLSALIGLGLLLALFLRGSSWQRHLVHY